ncbi:hypothetical protein BpHYR1_029136 [Brachionus plicatilis]|uniref:Uncharacterized protein n=1 Tax=Brachionus plicatilis TaxID=10195 RepID=A0A3M7QSE5_BRAPC|nr:hypothetical protein BpHYR1_029136 [Brachionus plicatilis]
MEDWRKKDSYPSVFLAIFGECLNKLAVIFATRRDPSINILSRFLMLYHKSNFFVLTKKALFDPPLEFSICSMASFLLCRQSSYDFVDSRLKAIFDPECQLLEFSYPWRKVAIISLVVNNLKIQFKKNRHSKKHAIYRVDLILGFYQNFTLITGEILQNSHILSFIYKTNFLKYKFLIYVWCPYLKS